MSIGGLIRVEVVYAESERAILRIYQLPPPVTVADVLTLAVRDPAFSSIDLGAASLGIFGRHARPDEPVDDGDRVEIYRPLAADPKNARRARVLKARRAGLNKSGRS